MGVAAQNFTVLAGTRLTLVRVHNEIAGSAERESGHLVGKRRGIPRVLLPAGLVHETPLQSTRETRTTTSSQTGILDRLNNPGVALQDDVLGFVPVPARLDTSGDRVSSGRGRDERRATAPVHPLGRGHVYSMHW